MTARVYPLPQPDGDDPRFNFGLMYDVGKVLEAHGFPVFSSTIALTGASKDQRGTVGRPVRVGGVVVAAGDWVVADVDGVTVVPGGALDQVIEAGQAREAKEAGFFTALKSGQTTVQLLGLDPSLIAGAEA